MKKKYDIFCDYLGSFIGFVGALLMGAALVAIPSATQFNESCVGVTIGKDPEVILELMRKCAYHFVGLKYPCLNYLGLTLLCVGFGIQFFPAIPKIIHFFSREFFAER